MTTQKNKKMHARYVIRLKNLKKVSAGKAMSNCDHKPLKYTFNRKLRGLRSWEYILYMRERGNRMRESDGNHYEDLDFFINKKNHTELKFIINQTDTNAGWKFADPAIKITGMAGYSIDLCPGDNSGEVILTLPGANVEGGTTEFKYTLCYDYNGEGLEHDPIISNGSTHPLKNGSFIRFIFYSLTISTLASTGFIMTLNALGILKLQ